MNAVVGSLRVDLGWEARDFARGAAESRGVLASFVQEVGRQLEGLQRTVRRVGIGLTAGLTVPFAGLIVSSTRGAAGFEAAMNRVEASLRGISAQQLTQLSVAARQLGPDVGLNAVEAAGGIETLALAGLNAQQILGGGLAATLRLSAANLGSVEDSAALVTDVMKQFGQTTADLPRIVNLVTGALDASKLSFEDFQQAASQAGGVAGSAGVSFEDFNTAIAATASLFGSGSDAGTSFKTFIQRLVPQSEDAERVMRQLGLSFYDATGRMNGMAEIAEQLRTKLGGLSERSRNQALTILFGSDAMRTAIGLMQQGRRGFEELQATIGRTDAGEKLAIQQRGLTAALNRLSAAFLNLKVAIGATGILQFFTNLVESLARFVQRLAEANPLILKIGLVFGALTAALGPLVFILGTIGTFLIARFVAGFGLIGQAVAFLIAPLSTLVEVLGALLARVGLTRFLGLLAAGLGRLPGPVGLVITAFILLRDSIMPVLSQLWQKAQETLGPPLAALFTQLNVLFERISSGPIGAALSWLGQAFGKLLEVVGTAVAGIVYLMGSALITSLEEAINGLTGVVNAIRHIVDMIAALLSGDFQGAWNSAVAAVNAAVGAIISAVATLMPGIGPSLRAVYEGAKAWLVDGFDAIMGWLGGIVSGGVSAVASIFPGVVDAARAVYYGVKQWLVDSFGPLIRWVSSAAAWIADKYNDLREALGLGRNDTGPTAPEEPPEAPAAPRGAGGTSNPSFDAPARQRRSRNNAEDIAFRREMMALDQALAVARARGDIEESRRIEQEIELRRRVKEYLDMELGAAAAQTAAQRDMADLQAARIVGQTRENELAEARQDLEAARVRQDHVFIRQRENELFLAEHIVFWRERLAGLMSREAALVEATSRATAELVQMEAARAELRERSVAAAEAERQVQLAQLRGDPDRVVRARQRVVDLERRAREIADRETIPIENARERASLELDEAESARLQGQFRTTFREGIRAALDGDFGSWFSNWWKERLTRSLEDALNNVADLLYRLFQQAMGQGGGKGGGDIFSTILNAIGGAFGQGGLSPKAPGFASGGSFKIGGKSGIDTNLIQFWGTRGEIVDIRRPGDGGQPLVRLAIGLDSDMLTARIVEGSAAVAVQVVSASKPGIVAESKAATFADLARLELS